MPIKMQVIGNIYADISDNVTPKAPRKEVIVLKYIWVHAPPLHIIIAFDTYVKSGAKRVDIKATKVDLFVSSLFPFGKVQKDSLRTKLYMIIHTKLAPKQYSAIIRYSSFLKSKKL